MRKTWSLRLAIVGFVMMMLVILFGLNRVNVYATEPNSNKEATDVLQVTVPTEIRAALMADGTVVTPAGLNITNHEDIPVLMEAYTDTDYGYSVDYTVDVDETRMLSRINQVDSQAEVPLELTTGVSKTLKIGVSKLTRNQHADLIDNASNRETSIFRIGYRFQPKIQHAFAVYSKDDKSLNFYKRTTVPEVGSQFEGKTVTQVFTGVENTEYSVPWSYNNRIVSSVRFVDKITPKTCDGWFRDFQVLETIDLTNLDTSQVTSMRYMFFGCWSLQSLDVSNFDTSNVTDMSRMFGACEMLKFLDVTNFDTSDVVDMSSMFSGCAGLSTLDLHSFNTSKVVTMEGMFSGCVGFKSLDLSNFNTSNVRNLSWIFENCWNLQSIDLSNFDASNITDMSFAFSLASNLQTIRTPYNIKTPDMSDIITDIFYDESDGYKEFPSGTFPTNITTSHTLVKERPYTISYDATGGVMPSEYPTSYFSSVGVETLPTPTRPGFVFDGWYEMGDLSSITVTPIGSEWSYFGENSYTNSSFSGCSTGSYTLQFTFDMPADGVVSASAEYLSMGGSSSVQIGPVRVNGQPSGSSVKKGRCEITIDIWYTNGYTRGELVRLSVDAKTQNKTKISAIPVGTTGDKHLVAEWTPREVTPIKGFVRISPEAELTPDKTSASIVTNWEAPADAIMAVKSFEMASDVNGTNAETFQVTDNVTEKPIWGKYLRKVMYDESGQYSGELDSGWVGPMTSEFFGTVDIIGTAVVHNRPSYEVNGPIFQNAQTGCENYHVIWEIADDDQGTNGMTHIGLTNGGYLEHEDVGKFIRVVVVARSPFSQYVTGQITSAWVEVKEVVLLNEVPMLEDPQVEENKEPMVEPEVVPDTEMGSEDEVLPEQPPVNELPQEEIPSEMPEVTIPEPLPEEEIPAEDGSLEDTPETMQEELEVVPAVWTTTKPIQAIPLVEKQLPRVTKPKNYEDGGMWL